MQTLSMNEMVIINGGGYLQELGLGIATGAFTGAKLGAASGTPFGVVGGAFLGAHIGAIGASVGYIAKNIKTNEWSLF